MSWTCGGIAFDWLMPPDRNGLPVRPAWQREARLVERPLLGTGDADISRVGYEAYRISGGILVSAANRTTFEALNGTQATLSDGTTSWEVVVRVTLSDLNVTSEGATGEATFTRPRAT